MAAESTEFSWFLESGGSAQNFYENDWLCSSSSRDHKISVSMCIDVSRYILYYIILYYTLLYYTILYYIILYCIVLYHILFYHILLNNNITLCYIIYVCVCACVNINININSSLSLSVSMYSQHIINTVAVLSSKSASIGHTCVPKAPMRPPSAAFAPPQPGPPRPHP